MVVATPTPLPNEKTINSSSSTTTTAATATSTTTELPLIDLNWGQRSQVSKLVIKACEDFGFFQVVNHGVPEAVIAEMEEACYDFFAKPSSEKETAGCNPPYGYGCRSIGSNGDVGEVEYLILDANPLSFSNHSSQTQTTPISNVRCAVKSYVEAVRELACEILELVAEGLRVPDTRVFSSFIRDAESDSLLRLNHYPLPAHYPLHPHCTTAATGTDRLGFGEHTDPQILTILRSNQVAGLQISMADGVWVPVPPHPTAFFVNVGDVLQAMTNGRLVSVRHRAMVNCYEPRLSMAYFGSPPLSSRIVPVADLVTPHSPRLYRSFTWADYKKATYSRRLGDSRLNLFLIQPNDDDDRTTAAK